jgi:hypothetical protein
MAGEEHPGAVLEAPGMAVDESRIDDAQRLVVDAEMLGRVVAHVGMDDIGPRHQFVEGLQPACGLEVQGHTALSAVAAHSHVGVHPDLIGRLVHLDHVGPEVGQHLGTERTRHGQAEVEDRDAVER